MLWPVANQQENKRTNLHISSTHFERLKFRTMFVSPFITETNELCHGQLIKSVSSLVDGD